MPCCAPATASPMIRNSFQLCILGPLKLCPAPHLSRHLTNLRGPSKQGVCRIDPGPLQPFFKAHAMATAQRAKWAFRGRSSSAGAGNTSLLTERTEFTREMTCPSNGIIAGFTLVTLKTRHQSKRVHHWGPAGSTSTQLVLTPILLCKAVN